MRERNCGITFVSASGPAAHARKHAQDIIAAAAVGLPIFPLISLISTRLAAASGGRGSASREREREREERTLAFRRRRRFFTTRHELIYFCRGRHPRAASVRVVKRPRTSIYPFFLFHFCLDSGMGADNGLGTERSEMQDGWAGWSSSFKKNLAPRSLAISPRETPLVCFHSRFRS